MGIFDLFKRKHPNVEVGQPYGRIDLNAVKSRYIDCSGDPAEFWGDTKLHYSFQPF